MVLYHRLVGLGPLNKNLKAWRSNEDVPLQVCLAGSNWEVDGGARFDCLSMTKKPKVRHTHKAGLRDPRLEVMEQRRWSS